MLENGDLILFFRYKGDIFGTTEPNRITFAKLKDEKDEDSKDASFSAINLNKSLKGEQVESLFVKKDLENISIISDKNQVEKLLQGD